MPAEARKQFVKDHIREMLKRIMPLSPEQLANDDLEFFENGMDSMMSIELRNELVVSFEKQFSTTIIFENSTLSKLALFLLQNLDESSTATPKVSVHPLIVPIQTSGTKQPLFCIHPVVGDVFGYYDLARALGSDYPVYGIRAQGFESHEHAHEHLKNMAKEYISALRAESFTSWLAVYRKTRCVIFSILL